MRQQYTLRYLHSFFYDLSNAESYISTVLCNPQAAERLVNDTEKAIMNRLNFPESFEPYDSGGEFEQNYYRIPVHNYSVYYVVIDDVMEVRRFLYSKRNLSELL